MLGKVKTFVQNEILSTLKGDIIGGISVAFVALPLALSFGVLSGAGAAAGVYGAICTGILTSIFGGTKAQISGPTGAMTVVLVSMANKYGMEGMVASMVLAGIFEAIMGLLKLGKYIRLIPKPVMVGFTNGIAILIFTSQFKYFNMSPVVCCISIALMLILPMINKKIPYAIITVIVGTVVSMLWFPMPEEYLVGTIPLMVPSLQIPNFLALNIAGSIPAFVEMMNKKADEIGCTNTHFANTHGLYTEDNYTSAKDLYLITRYAMENYPGFMKIEGATLAMNVFEQVQKLGIDIKFADVKKIELNGDKKLIKTENEEYICDNIVIATGRKPKELSLPLEKELTGHGISYCALCDGMFFKDKDVAVVGGGNSAISEALYLSNICHKVYLIHRKDEYRASINLTDKLKSKKNIELIVNSNVTKLNEENDCLISIIINNDKEIMVSCLFIYIGGSPDISFMDKC